MLQTFCIRVILIIGIAIVSQLEILGQTLPADSTLIKFGRYSRNALQEKLYVHTDRSAYLTGETLWFKTYYVDGHQHTPFTLSKVAYLEVLDCAAFLSAAIAGAHGRRRTRKHHAAHPQRRSDRQR